MASPNDVSMEEIPLGDDERDSIEYKILMAYAQRRLSVRKYGTLLENEANVRKSSSLTKRKVKLAHQSDTDGPTLTAVYQGGMVEQQSKKQPKQKYLFRWCSRFSTCNRPKQEERWEYMSGGFDIQGLSEETSQHQTSETADVSHIADKLAKLVTSRPQESPSDVSFRTLDAGSEEDDDDNLPGGSESKECDEEKIIQEIVSLLKQDGDRLDKKIKKDMVLCQHFKEMLSYTFFKKITDLFLEGVVADSTTKPGDQLQCTKVAFTMEVAVRLTAMDNHPMSLVLGFGLKYLREHFKPWIQDRGGWEKALASLDEEEVEQS